MNFGTGSRFLSRLETTAMSDIIFNLLIFFLLSSSFIIQSGIEVELPKVIQPTAMESKQVIVTLKPDGAVFINAKPVEWGDLRGELSMALDEAEERVLVVRGDDNAPLGRAVEVMDTARQLGAVGLALATRPKQEPEAP